MQAQVGINTNKYEKEMHDLKKELAKRDEKVLALEDTNRAQKLETNNLIQHGKIMCEKGLAFQAHAATIGKEFEGNE